MKKVFLVRKDVTMPYGEGNWQIMNVAEFKKFRETDEAKGRKFVRLFQQDYESDLIIKECEPDEARQLKTAMQKVRRNQKYAEKNGIVEIPYSQVNVDEEMVDSEELIADETQDVESIVDKKLEKETLYIALSKLTKAEKDLIRFMFLQDKPMTERELAVVYKVSAVTIHKRKVAVLKKLHTILKFQVSKMSVFEGIVSVRAKSHCNH